jgi:hypothetical protein
MDSTSPDLRCISWRVDKYDGKPPRRDAVSLFLKKWLPVREKLPFEVVHGGESNEAKVEHPEKEPYREYLKNYLKGKRWR